MEDEGHGRDPWRPVGCLIIVLFVLGLLLSAVQLLAPIVQGLLSR